MTILRKSVLIVRSDHLNSKAFEFAQTHCKEHPFVLIYFIFDGAYTANKYIDMPTDEPNLSRKWQELAQQYNLALVVCPASAARRGIIDTNLATSFRFGSIGELVEACGQADQVVSL